MKDSEDRKTAPQGLLDRLERLIARMRNAVHTNVVNPNMWALELSDLANELRDALARVSVPTEPPEWEMKVRALLWMNHGCSVACLYGDDGEMQCNTAHPKSEREVFGPLDFKRDPMSRLVEASVVSIARARQLAAVIAPPPQEQPCESFPLPLCGPCEVTGHLVRMTQYKTRSWGGWLLCPRCHLTIQEPAVAPPQPHTEQQ